MATQLDGFCLKCCHFGIQRLVTQPIGRQTIFVLNEGLIKGKRRLNFSLSARRSGKLSLTNAAPHVAAHLFAEGLPAGGPVFHRDVVAIEHVEHFEDRIVVAGHRQNAKKFGHGSGRTGHLPFADGVGAIREAAGRRVWPCRLPTAAGRWPHQDVCEVSSVPARSRILRFKSTSVKYVTHPAWGASYTQRIWFLMRRQPCVVYSKA